MTSTTEEARSVTALPPCPKWCRAHDTGIDAGCVTHQLPVAAIEDWPSSDGRDGLEPVMIEVRLSQFETVDLVERVTETHPLNIDILECTRPGSDVTWSQHLHVTSPDKVRQLAAALIEAADALEGAQRGELG